MEYGKQKSEEKFIGNTNFSRVFFDTLDPIKFITTPFSFSSFCFGGYG